MDINQELLNKLKKEAIYSDESVVEEYYGVQISIYKNIDKYLERIPNIFDKIIFAQWANNFDEVNKLFRLVQLSDKERAKFNKLLTNNSELTETIDVRILSSKYDFLSDSLDMIVANRDIQEKILSLTDEELYIFKSLYERLGESISYKIPQLAAIANKMGVITPYTHWQNQYYRYDELIESLIVDIRHNKSLSPEQLDNLLYLYTSNIVWNVTSSQDLSDFTKPDGVFYQTIDSIINEQETKSNMDINVIKSAFLLKAFGIDLISAKSICSRYDLSSLKQTSENEDLFEMYNAIMEIINEQDSSILLEAYKEFSQGMSPKPNFMRLSIFENSLRREFALALNDSVYKCNGKPVIIDGVRIYDAGTDFKMMVTAIGAYQSNFGNQENYREYWNSPTIRSHGNCCSLIGNDNLSMANVKNVIFGFSTMDENMLLLSSTKDINSTPLSKRFNIVEEEYNGNNRNIHGQILNAIGRVGYGIEFTSPQIMLDNTRGDYNELVYERRDLSSNPLFYKKNPDYIVYVEEYEDIDFYMQKYSDDLGMLEYLQKQRETQIQQFKESIKAAKDFNIPIVKINRERCAKNSISHINALLSEFVRTLNPRLISEIICEFENNRSGNHDKHRVIRDTYFSSEIMTGILNQIEQVIMTINDEKLRMKILNTLYNSILKEKQKYSINEDYRHNGQESSIAFDFALRKVEKLANEKLSIESVSQISLPIRR